MLFCDLCDRGFHMECCDPPLSKAPKGDVSVFYRPSSLYLYQMHTNLGNHILTIKTSLYLATSNAKAHMTIWIMSQVNLK